MLRCDHPRLRAHCPGAGRYVNGQFNEITPHVGHAAIEGLLQSEQAKQLFFNKVQYSLRDYNTVFEEITRNDE